MKFSIKDFFSKCDQIRRKLKKSLLENVIFCAVIHDPPFHAFNVYPFLGRVINVTNCQKDIF